MSSSKAAHQTEFRESPLPNDVPERVRRICHCSASNQPQTADTPQIRPISRSWCLTLPRPGFMVRRGSLATYCAAVVVRLDTWDKQPPVTPTSRTEGMSCHADYSRTETAIL